ncbi:hypothetical protein E2C01_075190 [Portunus trituberculatus]|uniref:Uncharacterized protein n=1 Tax=Portunus trituberculatus TaxID=210409 RepID=A0A5B7IGF4_PORTR|nr:hypothetical protein [Portunus trituberculatus]
MEELKILDTTTKNNDVNENIDTRISGRLHEVISSTHGSLTQLTNYRWLRCECKQVVYLSGECAGWLLVGGSREY